MNEIMNELINVRENYKAYKCALTCNRITVEQRHKDIIIAPFRAKVQKSVYSI